MFKAIYLTGTIVAFCFALLWLDVDEMREEMREEERGYYREKPHGKEKAALVWAKNLPDFINEALFCPSFRMSDGDCFTHKIFLGIDF